jgi:RNA polymerase sigma factor (sigma-70 family)
VSNDDFALIQQCLSGNRESFRPLVQRYQSSVFDAVVRMVADPENAKDIVQESFVKAFTKLQSYDPRYPFRVWITKIAINHAIDFLRKSKLNLVRLEEPREGMEGPIYRQIPDDSPDPLETLERAESSKRIRDAILNLDPKLRAVIVLRHFENMEYEQIAEALQIPMGSVKNRLFRARAQLQELLKPLFSTQGIN